jgi:hypothetical protein
LPRIGQASDPVVIEDPVNVISNVGRSSFHFLQVQKLLEAAHGRLAAQTAASEPWAELPTTGYSDDADPEPSEADSGSDRGAGGAGERGKASSSEASHQPGANGSAAEPSTRRDSRSTLTFTSQRMLSAVLSGFHLPPCALVP